MNIIFGNSTDLVTKYTKLELDTIYVEDTGEVITAYGIIETIPLQEFPRVEANMKNHDMLLKQYRLRNWDYCVTAINALMGSWNGELDSFYTELMNRIENLKQNPPGPEWNGMLIK